MDLQAIDIVMLSQPSECLIDQVWPSLNLLHCKTVMFIYLVPHDF